LEVVSISKTESIFTLWAEEPSFSNKAGTVNFEGIILNPGFKGSNGKLLTITFRAKTEGQANLSFSSGSVFANDGTGANILSDLNVVVISMNNQTTFVPSPAEVLKPVTENSSSEGAPVIVSSSHPDQAKWYSNNDLEFAWDLPAGALEVRTSISTSPKGQPSVQYIPAIKNKKIPDFEDGTYYFHLQIRTTSGWGAVAHYKFKIDTQAPNDFNIIFPDQNDNTNPQPTVLFTTEDDLSGIDHYEIKIGDGDVFNVAPEAISNPYILPVQQPGTHTILVRAIDKAGNSKTKTAEFTIDAINSPTVTSYPNEIQIGDILKVRGTSYPEATVTMYLTNNKGQVKSEFTKSNSLGEFAIIWSQKLNSGKYQMTVDVVDSRGARSQQSEPLTIIVKQKVLFSIGNFELNFGTLSLLALLLLAFISGLTYFAYRNVIVVRRKLKDGMGDIARDLKKDLSTLKGDIETELQLLQGVKSKKTFTQQEKLIINNLEKKIGSIEESIINKFETIKKDIR
jgi:hypothetical protein